MPALPPLPRLGRALLLFGVAAFPLHGQDPEPEVVEAPPVLVTTEGDAPGWSTVEELAKAAESGEARAAFQYAQLLETGDQVQRDPARALAFYRQAAEKGYPEALFRLGKIHHDALLGVPQDYPRALEFYRQAAYARVPEAIYNIGAMYVSGRGVKRDYVEGLAWLLAAKSFGAPADTGIEQVRHRLARRPEQIGAAEQQAQRLERELRTGQPPKPESGPALQEPVTPPPPVAPALPPRTPLQPPPPAAGKLPPPELPINRPTITIPEPPPPAPKDAPKAD